METSQNGIDLIKHFEGLELKAYQDAVGVWTIGYGHTKDVQPGYIITEHQAEEMLKCELSTEYEGYINNLDLDFKQYQFDALVSWVYNLGPANLQASTLLVRLRSGDFWDVPNQIRRWNKAGGKVLTGLVRRRNAEALLFQGKDWRNYLEEDAK